MRCPTSCSRRCCVQPVTDRHSHLPCRPIRSSPAPSLMASATSAFSDRQSGGRMTSTPTSTFWSRRRPVVTCSTWPCSSMTLRDSPGSRPTLSPTPRYLLSWLTPHERRCHCERGSSTGCFTPRARQNASRLHDRENLDAERRAIRTTRNIAAHAGYRSMDDSLFWVAITRRVPEILDRIQAGG